MKDKGKENSPKGNSPKSVGRESVGNYQIIDTIHILNIV